MEVNSRTIVDQMILRPVSEGRDLEAYKTILNYMDAGSASSHCLVTMAGMMEFCGFKFQAETFLSSVDLGHQPSHAKVSEALISYDEVFKGSLKQAITSFGCSRFKVEARERLLEQLRHNQGRVKHPDLIQGITAVYKIFLDWLNKQELETILSYWAIRVMTTSEFISRYVKDSQQFIEQILSHCLIRDIPCARLLLSRNSTIKSIQPSLTLDDGEEYLDEDAVWHLKFGKLVDGYPLPICFITKEEKIAHLAHKFSSIIDTHFLNIVGNSRRPTLAGGCS